MSTVGRYALAGTAVEVEASAPLDDELRRVLVDLGTAGRGAARRAAALFEAEDSFVLSRDGTPAAEPVSASVALAGVLDMMNDVVAEHWSRRHVALHAAVVERGGRALAFVGYSGSGKTTLAAAAVRSGWGFISDEVGLIDDRFVAHAYHRPLGLRRGGRTVLQMPLSPERWHRSVQPEPASNLGTLVSSAPLAALVFFNRSESAEPGLVTRMSPAAGLAHLLNNVLGTDGVEVKVFRRLEQMVRNVPVVHIGRCAPDDMLTVLAPLVRAGALSAP